MKITSKALLLSFSLILLFSCKKYEEGPLISFRSAKNRIYGNHTLTKYTVDGIDSLQQMANKFGINFRFYFQDYDKADVIDMSSPGIVRPFISTYYLINKKKEFTVKTGSILFTGYGDYDYKDVDFTITKLTMEEMHFKTSYNSRDYYFELTRAD
jgi:hypothetical protein